MPTTPSPLARGLTGAHALLRILRAMGVERIYASPGSDWAPLWEALALPHGEGEFPEYVSSRHEETAAAMALGYAKASGKLPALMLHTTVGALHATMILRAALHERVPMVVLAGEAIAFGEPPAPSTGRQWLRLLADTGGPARLVESCVKWSYGLNTAAILPQTVQRACQLAAAAPRGPVFLSIPAEFLMETMYAEPPPAALPIAPPAAPAAGVSAIAAALAAARNPVIVTEQAGRVPQVVKRLVALAETLGAPVVEAWQPYYVNFPRRHPLYGGVVSDGMADLLRDADAVLLVESVAPWHPPSALPNPDLRVLVLGEDPLQSRLPFWGYRSDVVVAGEVGPALAGIETALRGEVDVSLRAARAARWSAKHEAARARLRRQARDAGNETAIETRWVADQLNELLPSDAILVDETITHRLDLVRLLDRLEPGGFHEASYGGLGVGLGMALGVKHAQPERRVIAAIGDGAFHYNPVLASFGASQELGLPVLVLVFNNAGYLSQRNDVANYYPRGAAVKTRRFAGTSIVPRPEYAALARAYGGVGEKVERPTELREALARGLEAARTRLALVDIVLEPVAPGQED
jgi:acetolactate synthase-1/2/3 large subunit